MTSQEEANLVWQTDRNTRHLPDALRERAINQARLIAANSNVDAGEAIYLAQLAIFDAEMAAR